MATWAEAWPLRHLKPRVTGVGRRPVLLSGCDALLSAGFAGACAPRLRPGDVLVTEPSLRLSLGAAEGELRTVTSVASPRDKAALAAEGVAAVDMETAWLRERAKSAGLPFLGVRVIIDAPESRALSVAAALNYPLAARRLREAVDAALEGWP